MRPIRRFGTTSSIIGDRLSIKSHEKITSTFSRPSWQLSVDDDRRKLHRLFSHQRSDAEKENRQIDDAGLNRSDVKPEIIISTPSFQLVCDRRRAQPRAASADEAGTAKPPTIEKHPKSALKKSPNGTLSASSTHRSRWTAFSRRTVSFADDKGLQLVDIKLIDLSDDQYSSYSSFTIKCASGFIADFILPPAYRRLRSLQQSDSTPPLARSQIVLESYASSRWSVTGVIAVRGSPDAAGEKRVFVRYTNDQWSTSVDNEATLIPPEDGIKIAGALPIDRYSFTLPFPLRTQTGSKLEFKFGVRMPPNVGGVLSTITYWDDNHGSNYSFSFV